MSRKCYGNRSFNHLTLANTPTPSAGIVKEPMKALLYADWDTLRMVDVPIPEPGSGEVLVRVEAAGICGSELEALRNRSPRRTPPLILGHEFSGVIESVGPDVEGWSAGDAVVPNAVIIDGTCPACLRGETSLCYNRGIFGMNRQGAFAEYVTVPSRVLLRRPDGLEAGKASMTEPLANGVHVSGLLASAKPKTVVVYGAGPIGLFVMQAIRALLGSRVAMVDRLTDRLDVAARLGAEVVFSPDESLGDRLSEWAGSDEIDASVDAVGVGATNKSSVAVVRPGGTIVWIGIGHNQSSLNLFDLVLPGKKLLGSYASTQAEMQTALDLIADGRVDASTWTSPFALDQGVEAFNKMLNPEAGDLKAVLRMN